MNIYKKLLMEVIIPQSKIRSDKKISYTTTKGYAQTAQKTYAHCMKGRL